LRRGEESHSSGVVGGKEALGRGGDGAAAPGMAGNVNRPIGRVVARGCLGRFRENSELVKELLCARGCFICFDFHCYFQFVSCSIHIFISF
jgi:hypothetical protein